MEKPPYTRPEVERILLDNAISLTLLSPPLGPGDENLLEIPFGDPEIMSI
jgi:hypothetical protein